MEYCANIRVRITSAQAAAYHGAFVVLVLLPTKSHVFPVLEVLHRRSELELGPDVVFEHKDDFIHCRLENGVSRILIQSSKHTSAKIRCVRPPQQMERPHSI